VSNGSTAPLLRFIYNKNIEQKQKTGRNIRQGLG